MQFVSVQFEHMTQLLRHFYAFFLAGVSWNDETAISKMKKILHLLEGRLANIIAYKEELKSAPSAGADVDLLRFQFRCLHEVVEPAHEAMDAWERACTEKNIISR
jgi:hypothetical protein